MKELKLGVTGSRNGLTEQQQQQVIGWLDKPFWNRDYKLTEFHHGDCVGVDIQMCAIVKTYHPECKIICHPPVKEELRGFFESDEYRKATNYLARNRNIVDEVEMLIGFPAHRVKSNGGTWYTIKYAEKNSVTTGIFYPDGNKETV